MKEYIKEQTKILKQMCVWGQIPKEEKQRFKNCANEIQADNMMTTFRHKYL